MGILLLLIVGGVTGALARIEECRCGGTGGALLPVLLVCRCGGGGAGHVRCGGSGGAFNGPPFNMIGFIAFSRLNDCLLPGLPGPP